MVCPWLHMGTWPKNVQKSSCHHQHSWKNSEKLTTSGRGGQATTWMTGSSLLKLKFSLTFAGQLRTGREPAVRLNLSEACVLWCPDQEGSPSLSRRKSPQAWLGQRVSLEPASASPPLTSPGHSLLSFHAPSSHCLFWLLMFPHVL